MTLDIPLPPTLERQVVKNCLFDAVEENINWKMFYNKHMGVKGDIAALRRSGDSKFMSLQATATGMLRELEDTACFSFDFVYRFVPCHSLGDSILFYDSSHTVFAQHEVAFPRQPDGEKLCLADLIAPASSGQLDYTAMFACTCGGKFLEFSKKLRERGEYVKSHTLNMLAITLAEALAETAHSAVRGAWGFADPEEMVPSDRLDGRYRGKRFSFGYPACPDLSGQKVLFALLKPEDIGIQLSEGLMMEPEASVSALVFHNRAARSFVAQNGD